MQFAMRSLLALPNQQARELSRRDMIIRQLALVGLFIAFVLALSVQLKAQSREDAQKFAEARIAIDKYKDCAASLKALESISEEGRKNPLWVYYMGKSQECLNNLEMALKYYDQYSSLVSADAELIDKIADLRYKVSRGNDKRKAFSDLLGNLYPDGVKMNPIFWDGSQAQELAITDKKFKLVRQENCTLIFAARGNYTNGEAYYSEVVIPFKDLVSKRRVEYRSRSSMWGAVFFTKANQPSISYSGIRDMKYVGFGILAQDKETAERISQAIESAIEYCNQ